VKDELPVRIKELERRIALNAREVRTMVRELLAPGPGRYLVMERLPRIGSGAAAPAIELANDETMESEVRIMAALVALEVGNPSGVDLLLAEVKRAGPLGQLVAGKLAAAGKREAGPAILQALRTVSPSSIDDVVGYLRALHVLGVTLPDDLRAQLVKAPAWQVTSAIEEWFRN